MCPHNDLVDVVLNYISSLQSTIQEKDKELASLKPEDTPMGESSKPESNDTDDDTTDHGVAFPPMYDSSAGGEDFDKASDYKQEAADQKASGNWEGALEQYTKAVLAAPPSALLYANRAMALLKLDRPKAAERDCNAALQENPDSAKVCASTFRMLSLLSRPVSSCSDDDNVDDIHFYLPLFFTRFAIVLLCETIPLHWNQQSENSSFFLKLSGNTK